MDWWRRESRDADWAQALSDEQEAAADLLRRCTWSGRPFGNQSFVSDMSHRFGRHWVRGRPSKAHERREGAGEADTQLALPESAE